jgi:hypothetical protein
VLYLARSTFQGTGTSKVSMTVERENMPVRSMISGADTPWR